MNRLPKLFRFAIILLIPFITGCAYFNTLWNGWQAFDQGVKAKKKLISEKIDTTQIANSTKKDFERAVQKAEKTVSAYPKKHKYHDDAFYLKGRSLFELGSFPDAALAFTTLQKYYSESSRIPESWFWLGKSYAASGDYQNAELAYRYCLDNYPELNKNQEVTLLQAELAVFTKGKSQAIPFLEEALKRVNNPERRLSIINRLAGLYIDFSQYDNALNHLTKIPGFNKEYRDLYFEARMKELLCYSEQNEYEKAEAVLDYLLKNRHYVDRHAELRLEMALLYLRENRISEARKLLLDLTTSLKTDETVAVSWYKLAGIYIDIDSKLAEGITALEKTLSLTKDSELRADAKRRLTGLQSIKIYSDSLNVGIPDTVDEWELRFKLGERYWLDAKLPDSALVQYDKILADATVSKPIFVKTLFSKAWILQEMKKDTGAAKEIFGRLVTDYSSFAEAKESQRLLDLPVTIMIRKDSAEIKFNEAEELRLKTSGYSKEVYYSYLLTAVKFPDVKDVAAKSLYAAGWVINSRDDGSETVDTSAAKIFGRLCRDYPESDQCKAVTKMLQQEQVKGFIDSYTKFLEEKTKEPDAVDTEVLAAEKTEEPTKDLPPIEIPDFTRWFQ